MFLPTPEDIKKLRLELKLTQHDIATRAGVSQPLIARIESGDVDPRLSHFARYSTRSMQQGKNVSWSGISCTRQSYIQVRAVPWKRLQG